MQVAARFIGARAVHGLVPVFSYGDPFERPVIEMLIRLRDEHKFENVEALKKQLNNDRENALKYIGSLK